MATKKRLIIEGDVVTQEEVEVNGDVERVRRLRVKLADWQESAREQEGTLEFLPPIASGHIIARRQKGDKTCVVVQLPPALRKFVYTPDKRIYEVAMPYIILAINFRGQAIDGTSSASSCGIYWYYRNEAVTSLDDPLGFCNMPNIYGEGQICWGKEVIPLDAPLGRKVEMVVAAIFASNFNAHELLCQWEPAKKIEGHPQTFADWETRSCKNPGFVLKLAWRPAGVTVRQVMERWVK